MERVFEANASGLEVSFHETYAVFGCRENSTLQITLIYGPFFNKKVVTEINQNFNELRTYPVLFSFFFLCIWRCKPLGSMRFCKAKFTKGWLARHLFLLFRGMRKPAQACDKQLDTAVKQTMPLNKEHLKNVSGSNRQTKKNNNNKNVQPLPQTFRRPYQKKVYGGENTKFDLERKI